MTYSPSLKVTEFTTHHDEVVGGQRLIDALNQVADDLISEAQAIFDDPDYYALHVPTSTKRGNLAVAKSFAEDVRKGYIPDLTVVRLVNKAITGEDMPVRTRVGA